MRSPKLTEMLLVYTRARLGSHSTTAGQKACSKCWIHCNGIAGNYLPKP